jgi:endonuclease-3
VPDLETIKKSEWTPPRRDRMARIRERLRVVYGVPLAPPHEDPLAELVLTVLSQSTNDRNRDVAFLRLRRRFTTWEEVRNAPVPEVEEAIRPGGISKVKSQRIHDILVAIEDTNKTPGTGCATSRSTRTSRASGCACTCCAPARRSRSSTTRCSRSRRRARSSSSTSTCCATAAGPATRRGPSARVVR